MPLIERVALAQALVEKQGEKFGGMRDWRPLLRYSQGNPLTITVLVNQALTHGLTSRAQIEQFVAQLRAGEAEIVDVDEGEGRTRSLAASLKYGFERGFSDDEQKSWRCCTCFRASWTWTRCGSWAILIDEWSIEAVRGLTRAAGIAVLDRAAEAGLLTRVGDGLLHYSPGAALVFPRPVRPLLPRRSLASVTCLRRGGRLLGRLLPQTDQAGNPNLMALLAAEEDNLLAARRLALAHGWLHPVIPTMVGLQALYDRSGRRAEWRTLVDEIVLTFVDQATELPRPGVAEEDWSIVTEYRVRLAEQPAAGRRLNACSASASRWIAAGLPRRWRSPEALTTLGAT